MKNLYRKVLTTLLILQALFLMRPLSVHAEEMTCPPPVEVTIDVKPGDVVEGTAAGGGVRCAGFRRQSVHTHDGTFA